MPQARCPRIVRIAAQCDAGEAEVAVRYGAPEFSGVPPDAARRPTEGSPVDCNPQAVPERHRTIMVTLLESSQRFVLPAEAASVTSGSRRLVRSLHVAAIRMHLFS